MLSKHACIFIFIDVKDQEEADALLEPLKKEFEGIVDGDHILFSQTEMGRASMTRQLDSSAHFDFSTEVTHQASIFMNTILIAPDSVETTHFKWRGTNFKDFMTNGNTEFIKSLQK
ncbi:hypothetical protein TRFO_37479 [Tritrichomonas foetus]|uniref:Uncharacterized protein n=1 Tax=Tritrichomonas foetus TaxID=1144522 RepID=A0A1J4JFI0_9EUKA|nr:hypothetical protein TRFO_37479 [Tritrichomonas foetus]|eukprot:OHS96403.1 hypothetical protein TRFO_37479 [Tritrichomonas foetus]